MSDRTRREAAIERRLGQRRPSAAYVDLCPDVERLALLSHGALADEERAVVEGHVADCARCQDTLVVLARLDETSAAAPAVEPAEAPWWSAWRRWRWVVPVPVAAALAAVVYVAVRPGPIAPAGPAASIVARHEAAPLEAPPDAPAPAATLDPQGEAGAIAAESSIAEPLARSAPASPAASFEAARAAGAPPAEEIGAEKLAAPAVGERTRTDGRRQEVVAAETAVADAAPAPRPAEAMAAGQEAARVAPPAARSAPAAAPAGAPVATTMTGRARDTAASGVPVEIATPDPTRRWRLDANGRLSRTDDGTFWRTVALPTAQPLRAGACPTAALCWFVGAQGAVVRTVDGARWEVLTPPTGADLDGVEARSELAAEVWTADARFVTTDGGRTWRRAGR